MTHVFIVRPLDAGADIGHFRAQATGIANRLLGKGRTLASFAAKTGITITNLTLVQPKTAMWDAGREIEAEADLATGVVWFRSTSSIPTRQGILAVVFSPQDRPQGR
ncbi:MAG TPA: hypothetical protein VD973_17160 [Symbiobacteriaceae bacterium]|nr:hypothetical protein [Symbiobacteriaceae bacterium]